MGCALKLHRRMGQPRNSGALRVTSLSCCRAQEAAMFGEEGLWQKTAALNNSITEVRPHAPLRIQ